MVLTHEVLVHDPQMGQNPKSLEYLPMQSQQSLYRWVMAILLMIQIV
jgi:hypothetical protein